VKPNVKNKTSMVDDVVLRLRDFVERKKLRAGDRLPTEPELVADFGVSRTVLREALGRLQTMGLLSVQHGRGMFVADRDTISICAQLVRSAIAISPRDWVQYLEFRAAIEVESARLAAPRATEAFCMELERDLEQMGDSNRSLAECVQIDFRFHKRITAMSGNELLRNSMEVIEQFVVGGMVQTANARPDPIGEKLHRDIIEAMRSRDADRAEKAMRTHMNAVDKAIRRATGFAETQNDTSNDPGAR